MMADDDVGVIYTVWMNDNSCASVDPEDAVLIDRAVKLWAERRQDTWLSLHQPAGSEFSVLASTITSSALSGASQRTAAVLRDKAIADERAANRANAGFIESEE